MQNKIDVVLITKNAYTHSKMFKNVLDTLYREVPVSKLIIIDAYSTDLTIPTVLQYPNVFLCQMKGNRAVARQKGIELVETDWFLFLDDDVLLCPNWFTKASKYMKDPLVGLIWGWDKITDPTARNIIKTICFLRKKTEYALQYKMFQERGGTHDTLIRLQAVKNIQIPLELHVYEDKFIKTFVQQKGYKTIVPKEIWCYHITTKDFSRANAALTAKLTYLPFLSILKNAILAVFKGLFTLIIARDKKAAADFIKFYFFVLLERVYCV